MATIVETAVAAGSFTTLVAAVTAADLVDTLNSDGPFTVFAPTDEAFAALPEGTVEALLADIPKLTEILTFHVVADAVHAADVTDGLAAATVNGKELHFSTTDGVFSTTDGVTVNGAKVVTADVVCDNGVIHVIDAVLLP